MSSKQISISTLLTVEGLKKSLKNLSVYKKGVKDVSSASSKQLRGQDKLLRRLANNNTKAFNIASLSVGPLVRGYAELAASMWALTRTWDAVSMSAKFGETRDTFKTLGDTFSFNADVMLARVKKLSGGTVTAMNAMQNASLAMASGLNVDQFEKLTTTARRAARAMGRTMPDAFDRIIRAVTKLEPELLDEIGLTTRLQNILGDYAKSVGKTVDQITSLEKTQIFTNAVIEEGTKKFGAINVEMQSNAEKLEEMKTRLIDFSLTMSEKAIPSLLTILETAKSLASTILILGSAFAFTKVRTLLLNTSINLGTKEQAAFAKATNTVTHAEDIYKKAKTASTTASNISNTAIGKSIILAEKEALSKLNVAKAVQADTAAKIQNITITKLMSRAAGGLGKAMNFLTGPFGLVAFGVFTLIDAFGLLDGLWEKLFGSTKTLTDRISDLSDSEQRLIGISNKLGRSQEVLLDSIEKGDILYKELGDGISILVETQDNLAGSTDNVVKVIRTLSDGTLIYRDITGLLGSDIKQNSSAIKVYEKDIKRLKDAMIRAGEPNQHLIERTISLEKVLKQLKITREELLNTASEKEVLDSKKLKELQGEIQNTGTFFTELGISAKTFANSLLTPTEKFDKKLSVTTEFLEKYQARIDELPGKIDEAFALDPTSTQGLIDELNNLADVTPLMEQFITTLLKLQKTKEKVSKSSLLTEQIKSEIAILKLTKDSQLQTIEGTKSFYKQLDELQFKAFEEELNRLESQKSKLSTDAFKQKELAIATKFIEKASQLDKQRAASLLKLSDSQANFALAQISANTTLLESTKKTQLETISGTESFYNKLEELQINAFDIEVNKLFEKQDKMDPSSFNKELLGLQEQFFSDSNNNDKARTENLIDLTENRLNAILEIEKGSYDERINALEQLHAITLASSILSAEEQIALALKLKNAIKDINDERTLETGSIFDILLLKQRDFVENSKSANEIWADSIISTTETVTETLADKIGKGLGLITDQIKENYQAQLEAAQMSFQGQIAAANEAFGSSQDSVGLDKTRSLEDLDRNRARDIADLTAKRNSGEISQDKFSEGLSSIDTSVRRKTEDINIGADRQGEDAATTKQKSILDAHLEMNKAILEANKVFAEENDSIWTDMYARIGEIVLSSATQVIAIEAQKHMMSWLNTITTTQAKADAEVEGGNESLKAGRIQAITTALQEAPATIAKYTTNLPPIIGPIIGAAVAAANVAMATGLASTLISAATSSIGGGGLSLTSFHTGGTLVGSTQEIPFVGLKGEGILNNHNGMKALGGSKGLDQVNATGTLPSTNSFSSLNITIQNGKGIPDSTLTIDNFESFLRNKGKRVMRKVTKEGNILIEKQGISK